MDLIFRNDDINPSTDLFAVAGLYKTIKDLYPNAEIISCVTVFGQYNQIGSVYSETPFKNKVTNWFYDVDSYFEDLPYFGLGDTTIASHGLFHINHSLVSKDTQEMSILSSCRLLKTNIFCPPFNAYNSDTLQICRQNKIMVLQKKDNWKSFEFENFTPKHKHWYFHSWRFSPETLKKVLCRPLQKV